MHARTVSLALAALMLLPAITLGHGEQTGKIIAREQAFYETLTFGPALEGDALYAVLDPLSGRPDFVARLFRGVPGCLGDRGARAEGGEVEVHLSGSALDESKKNYVITVIGGRALVDFGNMREEGDHIRIQWYHCQILSHSLHTVGDRKHFLFKVADQPMFAWSAAGN